MRMPPFRWPSTFVDRFPALRIEPYIVTYNGMACGPCITRCSDYLAPESAASFGTAIEQIDIYARCQTRDPIIPGLEFMMDSFQAGLSTLPFIRFRRKARVLELSYASDWMHSEDMFGTSGIELPRPEFICLCREFAASLFLVRGRLRKSDDFEVDRFELLLQSRVESLDRESRSCGELDAPSSRG
jgi:hypothetical protein